ncbi:MAG: response regulator transcription factor [Oscillospiraceae bacterium]
MKIIIVEDDENIRDGLCHFLKSYGYEVFALDKFDTATEDILSSDGQLVLLDINLPMYDGYYICREIRKKSDIPIIMITSRDSELDELMSMNLGADDFIAKPYNTQILLARISSLLKRAYKISPAQNLDVGGVTLNTSNGVISFNGKSCELTKNEHKILQLLMNNQGKIISRTEIMNMLWQSEEFVDENTLTVNVNRLRRKLSEIGVEDFLKTKRGQGYYI